jgi:hypothetical protein
MKKLGMLLAGLALTAGIGLASAAPVAAQSNPAQGGVLGDLVDALLGQGVVSRLVEAL